MSTPGRRGNKSKGGRVDKVVPGADEPKLEEITSLVLQRVEQHLHVPILMPDVGELSDMKDRAPEAYAAFLRMTEERASADAFVDRAAYEMPYKLATRGQAFGLLALIAVLGFCAFIATLGTAGQIIGGIIAAIDLVAIIATLMGSNTGADRREGRG